MPKCEPLDSASFSLLNSTCASLISKRNGFVVCDGYLLPGTFVDEVENLKNFQIYDDDIWLCSFPKTGTTWAQEMVWSILNGFETTESHLSERFPFIDFNFLINKEMRRRQDPQIYEKLMSIISYENLTKRARPRYIKTHLPFELLPSKLQLENVKAKIIYVIRNPRDTCISLYHQEKAYHNFHGTLEQFAELFIKDLVTYGPFWKHVLSFWNQRHRSNVLIIRYEDMKQDLSKVLVRVSKFLDKPLSESRINQLCHHLTFDTMKNNPLVNSVDISIWLLKNTKGKIPAADEASNDSTVQSTRPDKKSQTSHQHLRSGKVDQWKEAINDALKENFEKWEMVNLKNTDYPLNYDV